MILTSFLLTIMILEIAEIIVFLINRFLALKWNGASRFALILLGIQFHTL